MKTTQALTPAEFGKLVKRSRERIGQLVREDRLPVLPSGRLDLAVALPAFVPIWMSALRPRPAATNASKPPVPRNWSWPTKPPSAT